MPKSKSAARLHHRPKRKVKAKLVDFNPPLTEYQTLPTEVAENEFEELVEKNYTQRTPIEVTLKDASQE